MPLRLGDEPDSLEVVLVPGYDFIETVEALNPEMTGPQPWPVDAEITLVLGEGVGAVEWPATVDTNLLSWNVQAADVAEVVEAGHRVAHLRYVNGTVDVPLAIGEVLVYG